jgi:hypothetical protein
MVHARTWLRFRVPAAKLNYQGRDGRQRQPGRNSSKLTKAVDRGDRQELMLATRQSAPSDGRDPRPACESSRTHGLLAATRPPIPDLALIDASGGLSARSRRSISSRSMIVAARRTCRAALKHADRRAGHASYTSGHATQRHPRRRRCARAGPDKAAGTDAIRRQGAAERIARNARSRAPLSSGHLARGGNSRRASSGDAGEDAFSYDPDAAAPAGGGGDTQAGQRDTRPQTQGCHRRTQWQWAGPIEPAAGEPDQAAGEAELPIGRARRARAYSPDLPLPDFTSDLWRGIGSPNVPTGAHHEAVRFGRRSVTPVRAPAAGRGCTDAGQAVRSRCAPA